MPRPLCSCWELQPVCGLDTQTEMHHLPAAEGPRQLTHADRVRHPEDGDDTGRMGTERTAALAWSCPCLGVRGPPDTNHTQAGPSARGTRGPVPPQARPLAGRVSGLASETSVHAQGLRLSSTLISRRGSSHTAHPTLTPGLQLSQTHALPRTPENPTGTHSKPPRPIRNHRSRCHKR